MSIELLALDAPTYQTHPLHQVDRVWTETNCYVDVWIEVLHSLGLEPLAGAAFPISTDFEGDQWTFYKYPPEDLRAAYGIDVHEMNPWRSVLEHIQEQLAAGRLLTVEADSWYLPDTVGVSYRMEHVKSTIVPNRVDLDGRRLGYFHNAGYFELEGDDFDGIFNTRGDSESVVLIPYVELVRLDRLARLTEKDLTSTAQRLLQAHLARRPPDNPVLRMAERVKQDLPRLVAGDLDFHVYAFATFRQCGAAAETASSFCEWLASRCLEDSAALRSSAVQWRVLSESARSAEFTLARAARGRTTSLDSLLASMADGWDRAQRALDPVGGAG
jgi:hypothetical protein